MIPRLLVFIATVILWKSFAVSAPAPKLVIAIVVDQLRYDYLERFEEQLSPRGFRMLMEEGAFLTFAHYDYSPTVTGPGHASVFSGAPPAVHGIISNDWFDKRELKMVNCVSDPAVAGVGTDALDAKRSPRNFIGSNVADEMRLRFRSKVIGLSLKDRSAILPSGKRPAGAYWFDSGTGTFVTSTYYMAELPPWVQAFNARKRPAEFVGQVWKRLLDPKLYPWPDEAVGEGAMPREKTSSFDHTIHPSPTEGFETIVPTPFGNQLLAEFALAAIEGERLGGGPQPDLLTVSFSSLDAAGHRFGPYSHEVQDIFLRLDRDLESFFQAIDKKIGLKNVAIVLTADHGVAPNPEFAAEQGLDGQRTDSAALMSDLLAKLSERFGPEKLLLSPRIVDGNLYLHHDALRAKGLDPEVVGGFIREWALATGRYQAVFTRGQLLDGRTPGALGKRVFNGFHPERSGDVVLVAKPFILPVGGKVGTTHGSAYSYDTHVPVLFFGAAFRSGRYADEFSITDLAPTLCAALRMTEPTGTIGKPLAKILSDQAGASAPPTLPVPSPAPRRVR